MTRPPANPAAPQPDRPARLVVVVGTGTDVGKTWLTCQLLRGLRTHGVRVAARKPAQSFAPGDGPTDADLLAAASGEQAHAVCPPGRWYETPMAPPMAADALGRDPLSAADLVAELAWQPHLDAGFVETAGGVRSPLTHDTDSAGLAAFLDPDTVVVVADAGLGTINSVRLAVNAIAHATATPPLVYLNRYDDTDDLHRRNRAWLTARDHFQIFVKPADIVAALAIRRSGRAAR
jgi:dethiobiotin synthetase